MIKIEHLTKKYGEHVAVDDLSLNIEPGRIYGFLGPNGAGKSTTMNIITGYLAFNEGSVTVDGHDILKDGIKARSHIGYLPEIPPLYPDMTVLEYLTFAAELKKIPHKQIPDAVDEVCVTAGISDVAGRLIRNLSKGYKQRVGLAQAILGDPDIIILDEPTVGLDPGQIIDIRNLIKELGREHTVILSSHILTEISAVCDYVFIISKGKLVAADETESLLAGMKGSQEVDIIYKSAHGIPELFADVPGVDHIEIAEEHTEEEQRLKIYAEPDRDIRAEVFKCAVDNNITLLGLSAISRSLEDVFLELTSEESGESGEPAEGVKSGEGGEPIEGVESGEGGEPTESRDSTEGVESQAVVNSGYDENKGGEE